MEPPTALYLECPNCGRAPHRVIRGRVSRGRLIVLEGVVRCLRCGFTRRETYKEWAAVEVPLIVSHQETSEKTSLELSPQEIARVGDSFEIDGRRIEVTAIEVKGRRVDSAVAGDIDTLWSRRADHVVVRFSLNMGRKTLSHSLEVPPDEEFEVGTVVDLGKKRGVIHRIKSARGVLKEGVAAAKDIKRVYCKGIRPSRIHRRPRRSGR